jgi:hypothetical protein
MPMTAQEAELLKAEIKKQTEQFNALADRLREILRKLEQGGPPPPGRRDPGAVEKPRLRVISGRKAA